MTFPGALEEFFWPAVRGSKDCKIRSVQWKEVEQDSGSGLTEPQTRKTTVGLDSDLLCDLGRVPSVL